MKVLVNYGSGKKETYDYEKVTGDQIMFTDSNNSKNSAVLKKTDKSMILTVHSDDNDYIFYPNISSNRDSLVNYLNEQYYDSADTNSNSQNTHSSHTHKSDTHKSNTNSKTYSGTSKNNNSCSSKNDLYTLKSEIVPPVCPACPNPITVNECPVKPSSPKSNSSKSKPQSSYPFVDKLNNTVKTIESKFSMPTSKQNSNQNIFNQNPLNQNSNQNIFNQNSINPLNQNSMLLPVQNYFVNDPTLALNGKSDTTNEPMPLLNSFSSFG